MAFKKFLKRLKLPVPGGTAGKYGKVGKIGAALALGPVLGPVNPASMDPEVLGARGSAQRPGLSVDEAEAQKAGEQRDLEVRQNLVDQAQRAADQRAIDDRLTAEEEARKKLRESSAGGYAATVLTSPSGLTTGAGAAGRRLYGS